ncbi:ABC transporter permease [Frankia sp. Cpl3]|uniref:ABC transporter permease n=1 Tax=Parafrankia colletiae TaxID=573497 RepID=UPI0012FF6F66|nr:ABC transporter permease [Parafrankia colletiae]MCK9904872.1 ABC transporter permease [Frankia sp. Cpl3]
MIGRLSTGIVTVYLAATIVFSLARGTGDPARQILGAEASPEAVTQLQSELGLDKPLLAQYSDFLLDLVTGDLGTSIRYGASNAELIFSRLGNSILLTAVSVTAGSIIGYLIAFLGATQRGRMWDKLSTSVAGIAQSIPPFWLGLVLVYFFSIRLDWLPSGGTGSWEHVILPAVAIAVVPLAYVTRVGRTSIVSVLSEDYVLAARSRGFSGRQVLLKHVLRASAIPVVTVVGLLTGVILSSTVTVEVVFSWPGIGSLVNQAVQGRDFPLLQALAIVCAVLFVLINFIVDLLYEVLDPRIRTS